MPIADDLDDLFATPRAPDDQAVSVDGIDEMFEAPPDDSLELGEAEIGFPSADDCVHDLLTVPDTPGAVGSVAAIAADAATTPLDELLTSLAGDLEKLATDLHQLLADDQKP